ncbi:MAG: acetyl-CoA carboxylase carboxyltransferase subunit alpha [Elusimicrobiota bacterium]|jgi:acetyl-CoA carboxylase carboxyl transferase subunit alpha|nr:acetyl-CoA carboxylase carboxyltransferase subunit alpha [Elusimicrobiota bacterium]
MEYSLDFEKPIELIEKQIEDLRNSAVQGADNAQQIKDLQKKSSLLKNQIYSSLSPWQRIQIARHPQRPYCIDYIKSIFDNFIELHGDRAFGDDHALLCGIADFNSSPVAVIGHQKGRTLEENMDRNFGMAHPEGYRKALRIMKLAEKFNRPIITFIDTSGAYPGIAAEERGQAEAIARNLRDMSFLKVPIITIVIGEGGSGGALGIGVSNRVLMLENSYYSVISPEGCAAILFRDASKAFEAAEAMKLTAKDLLKFKVIDEIIEEPIGGAHQNPDETASNIKKAIIKHLKPYFKMNGKEIRNDRYGKFRAIGVFNNTPLKTKKDSLSNPTKSNKPKKTKTVIKKK